MARALVTTSLLFCVGPLTILGSFEDGARGDILLLGIKSALDGVAALAFGASLGAGVLLSAVTVLVVQGSLTAAAYLSRGVLDPVLTTAALGAGGLMLVAIGLGCSTSAVSASPTCCPRWWSRRCSRWRCAAGTSPSENAA